MVASIVQTKPSNAGIATSVSATFTSAPTAGNLLVAVMKENGANAVTLPSGFVNVTNSPYTGGSTRQLYICYKVSDGTETGALTFSNADSNAKNLELYELTGIDTSSPVSYSAGNTNQVGVTTKALTTTGTLGKASNVAIAIADTSLGNGGGETLTVASGYTLRDTASFDQIMVADQVTTATTALAPTFGWTTSRSSMGFQAVFQAADLTMAFTRPVTATIAADLTRTKNASFDCGITVTTTGTVGTTKNIAGSGLVITANRTAAMSVVTAPEAAPGEVIPSMSVWEDQGGNDWALVGSINDYSALDFDKRLRSEGSWSTTTWFEDDDGRANPIQPGRLVTIDWRDVRTTWDLDTWNPSSDDQGERTLEISGPAAISRLGWEQAWPDPSLGIGSQPDPGVLVGGGSGAHDAETIVRTLVEDNWITRAGRDLVLQTNGNRGGTIRARGRFDNLLELVAKKAKVGEIGVDLQLVNVSSVRAELQLVIWEPQDRSNRVTLSEDVGSIADWQQTNTAPTATKAVVSGAGGTHQTVTTAEGDAAAALWGGHRVVYVPLPDTYDAPDQVQAGEEALKDGAGSVNLTMTVADTEGTEAFTHFNVGDKVRAVLDTGLDIVDEITSIKLSISDSYPQITTTFGDPDASDPEDSMAQLIQNQDRRLRQVEQRS